MSDEKKIKRKFVFSSPSGKVNLLLEVQPFGFTLWHEDETQWIVDASTISKDGMIDVCTPASSKNIMKGVNVENPRSGRYVITKKE